MNKSKLKLFVMAMIFLGVLPLSCYDTQMDARLINLSPAPWAYANFPAYGQMVLERINGQIFSGGELSLYGNLFRVPAGSFIPPDGTIVKDSVRISVKAARINSGKELTYIFEPSGCRFSTPAKFWVDWSSLSQDEARPYYVTPEGQYVAMKAEYYDPVNKKMLIEIEHFSRYSIAWGR